MSENHKLRNIKWGMKNITFWDFLSFVAVKCKGNINCHCHHITALHCKGKIS
jgi:hypothetical protein